MVPVKGRKHWLWRAVDDNWDVLDILLQPRRNKAAAQRCFRKLFRIWGQPRVIVTGKLRSHALMFAIGDLRAMELNPREYVETGVWACGRVGCAGLHLNPQKPEATQTRN